MWTRFMDMHSGGSLKEKWQYIYIEAPQDEAKVIFYNRFGHNPNRVTCTCCGEDYSINEHENIRKATAFERNCEWRDGEYHEEQRTEFSLGDYVTLEEYILSDDACVIYAEDIKDEERHGSVPDQGYVWVD